MPKIITAFLMCFSYLLQGQQIRVNLPVIENILPGQPVLVELNNPLKPGSSYVLQNQKTKKSIPAQLLDSVTLVFTGESGFANSAQDYLLVPFVNKKNTPSPVLVVKKENGFSVEIKGKPVLFYHTKEAMPPGDTPAYYRRSGFIHPLYSPAGKILTDDFPVGHVHQHAIFTAWSSTRFRNTSVDFWNQQQKKGTVEHVDVLEIIEGPVASQIKTVLRHKSTEFGEVLKETWTLTIYPFNTHYIFDLESVQENTSGDTLYLNKYHYGGLGFRGSRQWNHEDPTNFKGAWNILTSDGSRDSSANATHARWVNAQGPMDNAMGGVVVFNHPSNFRYPQAIRVHPTMPYWAYSPVVDGLFYIAPNEVYRSRFRFCAYDGNLSKEMIEKYFNAWASLHKATVIGK